MKEYVAAYDFGTSGVKVAFVTFDGRIVVTCEKGYGIKYLENGFIEQDPAEYWDAVCTVTRKALADAGIRPEEIKALNFSTQEWNVIPVSADGEVLYPAVSWLDGRAEKQAAEINRTLGFDGVRPQSRQAKILWFKEERPEIYDKTAYFMCCDGYLQWKATGVMCVPRDYDGIQVYKQYDLYLSASGVDTEKVAPCVQAARVYARLDKKGASELGLCEGTPVFGGCIDVPAAAAGAGCGSPGDAHIYLGSSGWLSVLMDKRLETTMPGSYQLPSIDPNVWIYGGCINAACLMQNWVIDQCYSYEKKQGHVFDLIEEELKSVKPGSNGMIATPWLFGEQFPICDSHLRTVIFNVGQDHTRADIMSAAREGVCYSILGQIKNYKHDSNVDIKRLGANGGGALSDHWLQCMADVCGVPVYRANEARHAGALGVAMAALVGLGSCQFSDIPSVVGVAKEFEPRREYAEMYQERFETFYELYDSLKGLYAKLNGRTES